MPSNDGLFWGRFLFNCGLECSSYDFGFPIALQALQGDAPECKVTGSARALRRTAASKFWSAGLISSKA